MSDWHSPIRLAERYLGLRLVTLVRRLPPDGGDADDAPLWEEFRRFADTLANVRAQLARPAPLPTMDKRRTG